MNEEIVNKYNYATTILNKGKWKKAMPIYKEIIKKYPCKEAYTNLGNCYRSQGLDKLMVECYQNALKDSVPFLDINTRTHLHAKNNLGLTNFTYGDDDKALALYTEVMNESPDFLDCLWNMATCELRIACSGTTEMFPTAWLHYNARFKKTNPVMLKNKKEGLKYWDRFTCGESIVILAEQGIGDNLMFARYLPLLRKYFKKIYVQCDDTLAPLFALGGYTPVYDAIDCDAEVAWPMCSLGQCFPLEIPPGDWLRDKIAAHTFEDGFNVGIVWAGNSSHSNDAYRSTAIQRFHSLRDHCNLYSLSPGFQGDKYVKSLPITSWLDTAKYINGLDLVVSIDTSVIHMCGCLGQPGYVLQPLKETDFRWGRGYGGVCPPTQSNIWYPSITVFNNPQSWDFVFNNVIKEIQCLKSAEKTSPVQK